VVRNHQLCLQDVVTSFKLSEPKSVCPFLQESLELETDTKWLWFVGEVPLHHEFSVLVLVHSFSIVFFLFTLEFARLSFQNVQGHV
jgi:hypothetical protein